MKHSLTLLLSIMCFTVAAQSPSIMMLSKPHKDHIELRWAPVSYYAWLEAVKNGYVFEKYAVIETNGSVSAQKQQSLNIKIAEMSEWEPYADNKYTAVAAECIFGERDEYTDFNPMVAYKKHNDNVQRYGFALYCADMDLVTARLEGLYYNDTDVDFNDTYIYTVKIASTDTLLCDTAVVMCSPREYRPLAQPEPPIARSHNRVAELTCNTQSTPYYIAYHLEKSSNGKNFERITDNPVSVVTISNNALPEVFFADSLDVNGKSYYYRVIGVDSFGEEGPPSESSQCSGKAEITNIPDLTTAVTQNNSSVEISWLYNDEPDADIKGFKIYRSATTSGSKELLSGNINTSARSFTDTHPLNDNYYFISVYNAESEIVNPFPVYAMLIDSIPPEAPTPPSGYCDSLGVVTLTWPRSSDPDVAGWRLFRANLPDVEYVLACPYMIKDTVFTDTISLNTSNSYVYYRLKAVDGRDNQSKMSAAVAVSRYDTIPPAAPRIFNVSPNRKKTHLEWYKSASGDVSNYIIYRKNNIDNKFDTLIVLSAQVSEYTDNTAEEGEKYYYAIQAKDVSNNYSPLSNIITANIPAKAEKISFSAIYTSKGVVLKWNPASQRKDVKATTIYRADLPSELHSYLNVQGSEFIDSDIVVGKSYIYCIRYQFADGTESPLSNEVKIEL
ncbi:MAG: hypothetical protein PUC50_14740 [Bacteroidales bacterium]|nr:hypothetical protein [Bacteroidales bacterium]